MRELNIAKFLRSVILLTFLLTSLSSFAGVVRSIKTNDKKMNRINLRMGQSTVLRFKGDRPKKVVIGNQNYYNVEFVEGTSDVTLQPLQTVPTNLFVYCQKNTYGFLLTTRNSGRYDDLVNINWEEPYKKVVVNGRVITKRKPNVKKLKRSIKVGNNLVASNFTIVSYRRKKRIIVDFNVSNVSGEEISLKEIQVFATRSRKHLRHQTFAVEKQKLGVMKPVRIRLVVNLQQPRGFTLHIDLAGQKARTIINKRYFK